MKYILRFLERQTPIIILLIAFGITAVTGLLDHFMGPELSTSAFYLLPIAIAAWFSGRRFGVLASVAAAIAWTVTDITAGQQYSHPAIIYWNGLVRLILFLIVARLIAAFRERMRIEESAADTDVLTGLVNRRGFNEQLEAILYRAKRYNHPLSIAYLDLDNFKSVNDTQGHDVGDQLLITVAKTLSTDLRNSDVIGRLGGDEFAILLTETGYTAAETAMRHAQEMLLEAMRRNGWPVTFSIGMVTFEHSLPDAAATIGIVDEVMYSVKKHQKNALAHTRWHNGQG